MLPLDTLGRVMSEVGFMSVVGVAAGCFDSVPQAFLGAIETS